MMELEHKRNVLESMRSATRAWAERFDWQIIAEDYRALYRELLGL